MGGWLGPGASWNIWLGGWRQPRQPRPACLAYNHKAHGLMELTKIVIEAEVFLLRLLVLQI